MHRRKTRLLASTTRRTRTPQPRPRSLSIRNPSLARHHMRRLLLLGMRMLPQCRLTHRLRLRTLTHLPRATHMCLLRMHMSHRLRRQPMPMLRWYPLCHRRTLTHRRQHTHQPRPQPIQLQHRTPMPLPPRPISHPFRKRHRMPDSLHHRLRLLGLHSRATTRSSRARQ